MIRNIPERLYREFFSLHPDSYIFPEVPNRNLVEFIQQFRPLKEGLSAVDLGCGEGRSSVFLAKEGYNVLSIDLSATIIKKGIERFAKQSAIDYCVGEITSLPIRSETFDLAVDITTLNNEKSHKRRRYVKEVRRILKKKGHYYVSVVSVKDPSCQKKCPKRHFILRKSGSYQQFYSARNLSELLSLFLEIISIRERKDGVSSTDEFESIEVVARR